MIFTTQPDRQPRTRQFGTSLVLHVTAVVLLSLFGGTVLTPPVRRTSAVLLAPAPVRDTIRPAEAPRIRPKALALPRPVPRILARTPLLVEPPPMRPAAIDPRPQIAPPVAAPPPPPPEKPVVTGTFDTRQPASRPAAPREIQSSGFATAGTAAALTNPEPRLPVTRAAGFADVPAAPPSSRSERAVSTAGFGSAQAKTAPAAPAAAVRSGGFSGVTIADSRRSATTTVELPSNPIEILHKPRPAYTDEARRLQIEGEVMVEAVFSAAGEVHVLRVVRGLGHGLDETAIAAARAIRFRPAARNGAPVDATAVVRISFQLAY